MTSTAFQLFVSRLGRVLVVAVPALLPLLPALFRDRPLTPALWAAHLAISAILVGVYFVNALVGLPYLLFRGRRLGYGLLLVLLTGATLLLGTSVGIREADEGLHHGPPRPLHRPGPGGHPWYSRPPHNNHDEFKIMLVLSATLMLATGTITALTRRHHQETDRRRQAEKEKLEVELAYLRTQLNPHVFFNTLNSIYVLTELNAAQARQAIIRLARLMRYLLYQTQETSVPLSQEVVFLEDYLALMKLRLTPNMQVDFEYPAQLSEHLLAPMLLQPFVENAFKYGVTTTQPATIAIALRQPAGDGCLVFEVRNQVFAMPQSGFEVGSGIGLTNTRRRLELLYPGRHQLLITERNADHEFVIHLTLHLS